MVYLMKCPSFTLVLEVGFVVIIVVLSLSPWWENGYIIYQLTMIILSSLEGLGKAYVLLVCLCLGNLSRWSSLEACSSYTRVHTTTFHLWSIQDCGDWPIWQAPSNFKNVSAMTINRLGSHFLYSLRTIIHMLVWVHLQVVFPPCG
jgi:hypothetical protein